MAQYAKHPKEHPITLELSDGSKFTVFTTYGKEGETIKLELDPTNHPAWMKDGGNFVDEGNERVSKFKSKFAGFGDA